MTSALATDILAPGDGPRTRRRARGNHPKQRASSAAVVRALVDQQPPIVEGQRP